LTARIFRREANFVASFFLWMLAAGFWMFPFVITVGLTGGIGMGKSTVAGLIVQRGIPLVDTDVLARDLVEPGQPALGEITALFGNQLLDDSGRLRRGELARVVFGDPQARTALEAVLHPKIRQRWLAQIDAWKSEGKALATVVIPLLFETNAQLELDQTICVACSAMTQQQRLLQRGWPETQIQQRIAAQLPITEKITRANFVLWNEATIDVLAAQLDIVLEKITPSNSP
jgi:dephospho-CoA kinase